MKLNGLRFENELNLHKVIVGQSIVFTVVMRQHLPLNYLWTLRMLDYTLEEAHRLVEVVCGQRAATVKQHRFQMLK